MAEKVPEGSPWRVHGFAKRPQETNAFGGEPIYRAYGGTSEVLGNCFFVPAINAVPIGYWTAALLERELNASLWGNDFEGITKFVMIKGSRYQIGSIAHDNYAGFDADKLFHQRAFFTPSGIFKQVRFVLGERRRLADCVKQLERFPIAAGGYAREMSARAKKRPQ